jgi:hypothetical protein
MLMMMSHLLMLRCGNFLNIFHVLSAVHQWQLLILINTYIYFFFRKMNRFQTGTRLVIIFFFE